MEGSMYKIYPRWKQKSGKHSKNDRVIKFRLKMMMLVKEKSRPGVNGWLCRKRIEQAIIQNSKFQIQGVKSKLHVLNLEFLEP
jgi:hypothetical protein